MTLAIILLPTLIDKFSPTIQVPDNEPYHEPILAYHVIHFQLHRRLQTSLKRQRLHETLMNIGDFAPGWIKTY